MTKLPNCGSACIKRERVRSFPHSFTSSLITDSVYPSAIAPSSQCPKRLNDAYIECQFARVAASSSADRASSGRHEDTAAQPWIETPRDQQTEDRYGHHRHIFYLNESRQWTVSGRRAAPGPEKRQARLTPPVA